jgi:transcriptional regulator with XRE-family HTH domain
MKQADWFIHESVEYETRGQTLRRLRRKLGLSLADVGKMVGVTRQAVSKWELDLSVPNGNHGRLLLGILRQASESSSEGL